MFIALMFGFFAGALAANGVPHFVKGITGQRHMTPFGRPSSALANVVWGWLNFIVAGTLWSFIRQPDDTAFIAGALGALITAATLAIYWAKYPEKNTPK
jgi:hypothetical protein